MNAAHPQASSYDAPGDQSPRIRTAQSCARDARAAVREFHAAVMQPDTALVIFFCSNAYDHQLLAAEIRRLFAGVQVVGCTTAGEIGPAGYREHSLSGASLPRSSFAAVSGGIEGLQSFTSRAGRAHTQELLQRLEHDGPQADPENSFALLLIDGLSAREETVTRALQSALGRLPLVGGSAGDGLDFASTQVFFDGYFHADAAILAVVTTALPFRLFKIQHVLPTEQRLVVTAADAGQRIVREIDGWPAAEAYARLIGASVHQLGPPCFAASPVVVRIAGMDYVRAIQKANPDGSLTFCCAIEEGLVLRIGSGADLPGNLEQAFAAIQADIGPPQLVLGCDCFLRKLEIHHLGLVARLEALWRANRVIGFNSYGEQFRGVHVNQTLVGIAIGEAANG